MSRLPVIIRKNHNPYIRSSIICLFFSFLYNNRDVTRVLARLLYSNIKAECVLNIKTRHRFAQFIMPTNQPDYLIDLSIGITVFIHYFQRYINLDTCKLFSLRVNVFLNTLSMKKVKIQKNKQTNTISPVA